MIVLLFFLFISPLSANPEKVGVKHVEGKGLGYSSGYTSLDLFFSQPLCNWTVVPFIDARGHVFNNGKYAYNAGLGLRWLQEACEIIWGLNGFYDFFQTSPLNYHQVGIGIEVLNEMYGLHLNGYLPVGKTKTSLLSFHHHNPLKTGFFVKGREQFAMKGWDAIFDYRCFKVEALNLYLSGGPYFYWGRSRGQGCFHKTSRHAYGGRVILGVDIKDYALLEFKVTYDTAFRWGGQVLLAFQFPFDWTLNLCEESREADYLEEKLYQFVCRNEIIVNNRIHRFSRHPSILEP